MARGFNGLAIFFFSLAIYQLRPLSLPRSISMKATGRLGKREVSKSNGFTWRYPLISLDFEKQTVFKVIISITFSGGGYICYGVLDLSRVLYYAEDRCGVPGELSEGLGDEEWPR